MTSRLEPLSEIGAFQDLKLQQWIQQQACVSIGRPLTGEGVNKGFFCLQVKGEWFDKADGEVTADFLQFLAAYGIYRVTRIDIQQTTETKKYLTPWWITAFEAGALRVIGKKYFEPRGIKQGLSLIHI